MYKKRELASMQNRIYVISFFKFNSSKYYFFMSLTVIFTENICYNFLLYVSLLVNAVQVYSRVIAN